MVRDGYPSIILTADIALTELAAALGECLGTPHVTLYHWCEDEGETWPDADPMIIDVGSFDLAAPCIRASVVRHKAGDAKMHVDIDYDILDPPPLPAFAARLAAKLEAPVIYDSGARSPFAYYRAWPDGRVDPVYVDPGEGAASSIRPDPHEGKAR
ncbi:MAG: hypothetical protein JNJ73_18105 [Hyphomonadaceae bacterium]|nr:hypothetical protein [Hyphomonadaceae bacterium]